VDCYRLKGAQELLALGWKEIVADPRNIVVVEWADKVKSIIPKDALWLTFSHAGKTKRTLSFVSS
jgi:tRNA A37 threonylcarbamoyladenosine biosynthesis protein TsaE